MNPPMVKQNEQQMVMTEEARYNKRPWESFPEPRGWALRWDGFELRQSAQRDGHNTQYPIEPKGH